MKRNIFVVILLTIALAACAQQKSTTGKSETTKGSENGYSYIKMRRTPCFGACPVYHIEVFNDGRVTYTGTSNTKYMGSYTKNVGKTATSSLIKQFETYRVDTCQNTYDMLISDIPGIVYNMKYNGKDKEIRNAHFGPKFLATLATAMDKIGEPDATWQKVPATDEKQ